MDQLKYKNIPDNIMEKAQNKYEERHGIETKGVKEVDKLGNFAFFKGEKTDNTNTLFFAMKIDTKSNNWRWICPNEEHIEMFTEILPEILETKTFNQEIFTLEKIRFDNIEKVRKHLTSKLPNYEIRMEKKGEASALITARREKYEILFLAIKPTKRFNFWFLFSPTEDQINYIIKHLKEKYKETDTSNEENRWT